MRSPQLRRAYPGAAERVIVEMAGLHTWGNEASERLMLEKMWNEIELLMDEAETVEHQGFDRMASGHHPHFWVLLGGLINHRCDAEFFTHARDQTQVIEDLCAVRLRLGRDGRAIRVSQSLLLGRGMVSALKITQ